MTSGRDGPGKASGRDAPATAHDETGAVREGNAPTPARLAADARAARERPALSRWSERRRRVAEAEGEAAPPPAPPADALAANRAAAEAIDVEALGPGADVSALLREGVPDALRRTALRALWRSDPVFGNVDRLCDYDDDFRDPKMVLETLQSAWQAGRGYLFADEADGPDDEAPAVEAADARSTDPSDAATDDMEPMQTALSESVPVADGDAALRSTTVEPLTPLGALLATEPTADPIADTPASNERPPDEPPSREPGPNAGLAEAPSLRARLGL